MSAPGDTSTAPGVLRANLGRAAAWAVSLAALGFVAYVVPFRDRCLGARCEPGLLSTLREASALELFVLLGVYLAGTFAWAVRWRGLLELAGVRAPALQVWRVIIESQAGAVLLPGGVAGDALRLAYARARAREAALSKIVASLLADRILGLASLAGVACVLGLASPRGAASPALPLLAMVPVAVIVGGVLLRHPVLLRLRWLTTGWPSRWVRPLLEYAAAPQSSRVFVRSLAVSVVVSTVQLVVLRGLLHAMGATVGSEALVYAGFAFGLIVAALPATPGAWGTADAAFVYFLGQAGVDASSAAAACLLYRMFWYASGVLGALSALSKRVK